ncbi:jupiter microtubule associated homolog 1-like [Eublepharis macularius]|uniref:Jupiter microtubule associated homolog 1-like n=1 Tax=Eublepharis macularius TaxID=481883 RepID=A0AA97LF86_EUBMA|nr:jupiter microtubule associated homolog 1-like [Eublepharis macularius]
MTTTTTFKGMDPRGRSSSRVLCPPGGSSNFSLRFDEPKVQPMQKNRMASSIFGTVEENPPSWARSTAAKPGDISDSSEAPGSRRKPSDADCGDFVDPKGGEFEIPENTEAETKTASGPSEEKPLPAAPVPSPVAPAPSKRNPPGGKSSLVLG